MFCEAENIPKYSVLKKLLLLQAIVILTKSLLAMHNALLGKYAIFRSGK